MGRINPFLLFSISSCNPPASEAITGVCDAMASSAASPKLSFSLVERKRSAIWSISSMASIFPNRLFFLAIFFVG